MNNRLTYSRLQQHNVHQPTDNLYDPLRQILTNPRKIQNQPDQINKAISASRVSRDFRYLQGKQASILKQHTLIPIDKPLKATQNFQKVRGSNFVALDVTQRVIGSPISPQQMQSIKRQGLKQQKVVYDFQSVRSQPEIILEPTSEPVKVQPEIKKTSYKSPPIQEFKPKQNYKYNLYSMIDEPANRIKQFGCSACTCPGNQFIASRNQPQSLNWLK